jgi:hypothetical protein
MSWRYSTEYQTCVWDSMYRVGNVELFETFLDLFSGRDADHSCP